MNMCRNLRTKATAPQNKKSGKMHILFLMQLPPPIHGASMINKSIQSSLLIATRFNAQHFNISTAEDIADIGTASPRKLVKTLNIVIKSLWLWIRSRPDLTYLTLAPTGLGFYKDGLIAILLKALGARLVIHLHGKGVTQACKDSVLNRIIYAAVFRNTDVIHLSERLTEDLRPFAPREKIHIVPNGIPEFAGETHKLSGEIHFIYLSNLVREKGAMDLLNACDILCRQGFHFRVTMAGRFYDVNFEQEFRERWNALGLRNVALLDQGAYGAEKTQLLACGDVLVLPTYYPNECFPITLLEAMAASMAVISTDEGAIADMITPKDNGILVEKRNPSDLAEAMKSFINSPSEAQRMGGVGYQRYLQLYTFSTFEHHLAKVLQTIADRT